MERGASYVGAHPIVGRSGRDHGPSDSGSLFFSTERENRATQETWIHLFADCRFVKRIWNAIASWARVEGLKPTAGQHFHSVEDWWTMLARLPSNDAKVYVASSCWYFGRFG